MRYIRLSSAVICFFILLCAMSLYISADYEAEGKIVVAIDPGHGGIDGGSDKGTYAEKVYNMKLSEYLKAALEENGNFRVVMTREDDILLKFPQRALSAAEGGADVILSMHCNTVAETYVSGATTFVSLIERYNASDLAGMILDNIYSSVGIPRGKVQIRYDTGDALGVYYWNDEHQWDMPGAAEYGTVSDYYSLNTWASKFGIPSIIIEHGYLTNSFDLSVLDSDDNLKKIAQAEADALASYYLDHEHVFGDYERDYPSNCMFTGTESRRCSICGIKSGTRSLEPDPEGHFWRKTDSKEPTCTEGGYVNYVCQITYSLNNKGYPCDSHEYTETLPATGHDFEIISETKPTHTENGITLKRCRKCGIEEKEEIYGEGHNYELIDESPSTCTEEGYAKYICSVCGDEYTEILPVSGHDYEVTEDREATHTEDGILIRICKMCGDKVEEIREAEGHDFVETGLVEPTCTEYGKRTMKCTVCGEEKEYDILPLGHIPVDLEDGGIICERCGEVIKAAPFRLSARQIAAIAIGGLSLIAAAATLVILLSRRRKIR